MEHLGPNGGFIYCMDYLEANLDWLDAAISQHADTYLLFDCPGQVELYTVHAAFKRIVEHLQQKLEIQLCAVNLVDSIYCCHPHNFLSALLVSLTSMLQLELPHINVLSKIDLLRLYQPAMDFNIDFYTEVQDLSYLVVCVFAIILRCLDQLGFRLSPFSSARSLVVGGQPSMICQRRLLCDCGSCPTDSVVGVVDGG